MLILDYMKNLKTFWSVQLPYFFKEVGKVLKVILYEILIALVVMGILYVTNFRVEITKNVQVISPIQEVK